MDIAVIGTGYVGLVTGAGLADFGNDVICCDIDPKKIDALNNGQIPIYEPGLDKIVSRNVGEGRLRFTTDLADAISRSRAIFIAVGTPPKPDGSADLRYVEDVARTIAQHMNGPKLVITKSTVPIGTGRMIEQHPRRVGQRAQRLRRLESRVPARRLGHRRLHASPTASSSAPRTRNRSS